MLASASFATASTRDRLACACSSNRTFTSRTTASRNSPVYRAEMADLNLYRNREGV